MEWLIYVGAGAVSGWLAGALGIGAGALIVPALLAALPLAGVNSPEQMKIAIATTLAVIAPTAIASAQAHSEKGLIDYGTLARFAPGVALGAAGGAWLAATASVNLITALFVVFTARTGAGLAFGRGHSPMAGVAPMPGAVALSVKGAGIGVLSCLTGVGGGASVAPLLNRYMSSPRAASTTAFITLALSAAAVGGYLLADAPTGCGDGCMGYVYLPAAGLISVAAMLAAPWGARAARALPVLALRRALGIALFVIVGNLVRNTPMPSDVAAFAQALFEKPENAVTIAAKSDRDHPKPVSVQRASAARPEPPPPTSWPAAALTPEQSDGELPRPTSGRTADAPAPGLLNTPWPAAVLAPKQSFTADGKPLYPPYPPPVSGKAAGAPGWLDTPWPEAVLASDDGGQRWKSGPVAAFAYGGPKFSARRAPKAAPVRSVR
jgi:uncharacterized membrane protein YfcA